MKRGKDLFKKKKNNSFVNFGIGIIINRDVDSTVSVNLLKSKRFLIIMIITSKRLRRRVRHDVTSNVKFFFFRFFTISIIESFDLRNFCF